MKRARRMAAIIMVAMMVATTKSISVNVPQKNGYTVSFAKRTGAAAKKNVTVKLNAKKTKVTYKIKKINANVSLKFIYKKKATPKPAVNPTTPAEEPPTET